MLLEFLSQTLYLTMVVVSSQGSYPTLIVILVCMQKSPVDYYSTQVSGMQFANGVSFGSYNNSGHRVARHVYTIRREYVTDSDTQVPSTMFVKTLEEKSV
jgi:hypothetical protein